MSIIYLMIPLGLVLLGVAVWALFWAIRSGQFDDLESQGWTVVLDDDSKPRPENLEANEDPGSGRQQEHQEKR